MYECGLREGDVLPFFACDGYVEALLRAARDEAWWVKRLASATEAVCWYIGQPVEDASVPADRLAVAEHADTPGSAPVLRGEGGTAATEVAAGVEGAGACNLRHGGGLGGWFRAIVDVPATSDATSPQRDDHARPPAAFDEGTSTGHHPRVAFCCAVTVAGVDVTLFDGRPTNSVEALVAAFATVVCRTGGHNCLPRFTLRLMDHRVATWGGLFSSSTPLAVVLPCLSDASNKGTGASTHGGSKRGGIMRGGGDGGGEARRADLDTPFMAVMDGLRAEMAAIHQHGGGFPSDVLLRYPGLEPFAHLSVGVEVVLSDHSGSGGGGGGGGERQDQGVAAQTASGEASLGHVREGDAGR
eukprot:jgi/Mesvir1/5338/Mv15427-RA.1